MWDTWLSVGYRKAWEGYMGFLHDAVEARELAVASEVVGPRRKWKRWEEMTSVSADCGCTSLGTRHNCPNII